MLSSAVILSAFTGETTVVTAENADELIAQITAATSVPPSSLTSLLSVTGGADSSGSGPSTATAAGPSGGSTSGGRQYGVSWIPYTFAGFQEESAKLQHLSSPLPSLFDSLSPSLSPTSKQASSAPTSALAASHQRSTSAMAMSVALGPLIPHAGEMPLIIAFDRRWFASPKKHAGAMGGDRSISSLESIDSSFHGRSGSQSLFSSQGAIPPLQPDVLQLPLPSDADIHDMDEDERHLMSAFLFLSTQRKDISSDAPAQDMQALLPAHIRAAREQRRRFHDALEVARALHEGGSERAQSIRLASMQLQRQCLAARAAAGQTIDRCSIMHKELKALLAMKIAAFKDAAATAALAPLIVEELRRIPLHTSHIQSMRSQFSDARTLYDVLPRDTVVKLTELVPASVKKAKVSIAALVSKLDALDKHLRHLQDSVAKHECAAVSPPSEASSVAHEPSTFVGNAYARTLWAESSHLRDLQQQGVNKLQEAYTAAAATVRGLLTGAAVSAGVELQGELSELVQEMRDRDELAHKIQHQAHGLLLQNAELLNRHLQYMSIVQSDARTCQETGASASNDTQELEHLAGEILALQDFPRAYNALVLETVRRTAFKRAYLQAAEQAERELAEVLATEAHARHAFSLRHGIQLPEVLLSGLQSVPPKLHFTVATAAEPADDLLPIAERVVFDTDLPQIVHATLATPLRPPMRSSAGDSGPSLAAAQSPVHFAPAMTRPSPGRPLSPSKAKGHSPAAEAAAYNVAKLEAELASVLAVARVPHWVAQRYAAIPADARAQTPASPVKSPVSTGEPAAASPTWNAKAMRHAGKVIEMCEAAASSTLAPPAVNTLEDADSPAEYVLQKAEKACSTALAACQQKIDDLQSSLQSTLQRLKMNHVSISAFAVGSNALFLPVGKVDDSGTRVYLAFNVGAPHHYLDPENAKLLKAKNRWPDFVVGCITRTRTFVVPADTGPSTPDSTSSSPKTGQPRFSRSPHTPPMHGIDAATRSPALGGAALMVGGGAASSSPSIDALVHGSDGVDALHLGPAALAVGTLHPNSNPFHLHAGTTFHIVAIEPLHGIK